MGSKPQFEASYLKSILDYDAVTGVFTWRSRQSCVGRHWNTRYAGTIAGTSQPGSYVSIRVNKISYMAHHLAWLWMTGDWSKADEIDHKDLNRSNNAWSNLREATRRQNKANSGVRCNNKTGFPGVYRYRDGKRWQASIRLRSGRKWLGIFNTPEAAGAAYYAAAVFEHGEFARAA